MPDVTRHESRRSWGPRAWLRRCRGPIGWLVGCVCLVTRTPPRWRSKFPVPAPVSVPGTTTTQAPQTQPPHAHAGTKLSRATRAHDRICTSLCAARPPAPPGCLLRSCAPRRTVEPGRATAGCFKSRAARPTPGRGRRRRRRRRRHPGPSPWLTRRLPLDAAPGPAQDSPVWESSARGERARLPWLP
jgi:hypothetical protein